MKERLIKMSFYYTVYTFFLYQFYCDAAKFCSKYKCERTHGNVIAGHFSGNIVLDRFLNDTDQDEFTAKNETNCVKACVKNDPCRTISVVPDTNSTNVTCYLSQSNIYETKPVYMKGAKIISLGTSACASSPCKKGSQCQPNYETSGYFCSDIRPDVYLSFDESVEPECKDQSSCMTVSEVNGRIVKKGSQCQPNYETGSYSCSDIRPDVHLSFDESVEPECKDQSSCMTVSEVNGRIVKVHDAKTPVFMTPKGTAGVKYMLKNMDYLRTPLASPRNLTIATWFKNSGTPEALNVMHKGWTFAGGVTKSADGRIDYFFGMSNGNPLSFDSAMCGQDIPAKVFNSWTHYAFRLTTDMVELAINGKTCGALDISSLQRPSTDTRYSDVAFLDINAGVEIRFMDALSIYKDFKSAKFVKELYEKEKANYFIV